MRYAAILMTVMAIAAVSPARGNASGERRARALRLVDRLAAGDAAGAAEHFDRAMKAALPPASLGQVWQSLVAQAGPYEGRGDVREQGDIVFIVCTFKNASLDAKVHFNPSNQVAGLWFAPSAAAGQDAPPATELPDGVAQVEVSVGAPPKALGGTVTMPTGPGPFPLVVLVHGSGPHDRDETIGPNKPFRDLAHGLAAKGIAVLRYEKRSKAHPAQIAAMMDTLTVKEVTVDDALLAAAVARTLDRIDPDRVYVLGHSLGGTVAPRIAKRDPRLAGLILLAASNRPLEDVVIEQATYLAKLDGTISPEEKRGLDHLAYLAVKVKDHSLARGRYSPSELPLGLPKSFWLDFRDYDPVATAAELPMPMFIGQGGRDYQVTKVDYLRWYRALSRRPNVRFKLYPKLNHLFMTGRGRSSPAEYMQPSHVSEAVVNDIAGWISRHGTGSRATGPTKRSR